MSYAKSVIYTISKNEFVYVGSTRNYTKRKSQHKSNCNNETSKEYNLKLFTTIRANGGWNEFEMKPYSQYPCETKMALVIEEERIRQIIGNLNTYKAYSTTTPAEYRAEHKDEIAEYHKFYYAKHQNEIAERQKVYRTEHKDKISERHKLYDAEHKHERSEYGKIYRSEHKDEIRAKNKALATKKIECACGKTFGGCVRARHERSLFHLNFLEK